MVPLARFYCDRTLGECLDLTSMPWHVLFEKFGLALLALPVVLRSRLAIVRLEVEV